MAICVSTRPVLGATSARVLQSRQLQRAGREMFSYDRAQPTSYDPPVTSSTQTIYRVLLHPWCMWPSQHVTHLQFATTIIWTHNHTHETVNKNSFSTYMQRTWRWIIVWLLFSDALPMLLPSHPYTHPSDSGETFRGVRLACVFSLCRFSMKNLFFIYGRVHRSMQKPKVILLFFLIKAITMEACISTDLSK